MVGGFIAHDDRHIFRAIRLYCGCPTPVTTPNLGISKGIGIGIALLSTLTVCAVDYGRSADVLERARKAAGDNIPSHGQRVVDVRGS